MYEKKVQKEIEGLKTQLSNLETIFNSQKQDFQKFISRADYNNINEIETYTDYTNLKKIVQDIKEVKIKIRCLEFAIRD